ncbi:neurogenic locus notch homolog protein 1-like isoform X2 [Acanthaster planci]|uniref:Neurogenic locus notch homolog protein 1-like isoform X2 n=1 Tax=Acanthaster planci TaxID=133434 RepID=A0A8B8A7A3_ACAPL|nr:neurogenic locus notch homolog protein 1-like isoform X2 [Acanthaster planci]
MFPPKWTGIVVLCCVFTVHVVAAQDNEPPILSCPNDVIKKPDSGSNTTVNWDPQPSANDTVDGDLNVTCQDASGKEVKTGEQYSVGETIVTCKANDSSGNEGSCSFSIKIDNEAPNITCPGDRSVNVAEGKTTADLTWVSTAKDVVDGELVASCVPQQGEEFAIKTEVTCTATDFAGNNNSCSFTITVTVDGKDCEGQNNCVCGENGKNCSCKENFSGPDCSVLDAAGCSSTNTYCDCSESCMCKPGFKGPQCNDCKGCMNGGYHQDIATCQCQCPGEGFEAPLCSGCKECVNGGNQNPDTCVCDCPGLYEGDLCDYCPQNTRCENGGTLDNATCSCDCPFQWTGRNCSDCKGCENEGTGQNATTCECVCLEGFLPPLCSDCESCKNGGAFQNDFTCACECPGLWSGLLCNLCPSGNVCENGGEMQRETCSCQCTEEWTGSTCTEPVPTVPDDEYPDPPAGVEIDKRVVFEISVISAGECDPDNSTDSSACKGLVEQFTTEVEKEYERLAGFKQVEINQGDLKKGSVIVPHAAIYDYGKMAPSKRGLSAFDLYRETVATAVASGKLGNLELDRDCMNCAAPEDETNTCRSTAPTCATGFQVVEERVGNSCYYVCRAACKVDTDFCQNGGTCSQDADGVKSCRCPQNSEFMYLGVNCQLRVQLLWLYVGCGIGGAVLLFLVVALISCVAIYRKRAKRIEEDDESEEGEMKGEVRAVHHNKGFEGDSASVAEEQVEGETAVPVVETTRPYSYIYSNGGGVGVSRSSSGAAAPGKNRYENSVARDRERETGTGNNDQAEDTSDKARSSYFWGNLAVPSKEDAEMIPMVSAVDPTKMYKIQRPQLSVNRNDDLPERDYF